MKTANALLSLLLSLSILTALSVSTFAADSFKIYAPGAEKPAVTEPEHVKYEI